MVILGSIVIICGLLLLGVSVYIAFGAVLFYLAYMGGYDITGYLPAGYWKMNTLVLLAIPLFMLTGELMNEGGMTSRLFNAARVFVGGFRGGLDFDGHLRRVEPGGQVIAIGQRPAFAFPARAAFTFYVLAFKAHSQSPNPPHIWGGGRPQA